jgi:hypothetical protein
MPYPPDSEFALAQRGAEIFTCLIRCTDFRHLFFIKLPPAESC